MGSEKWVALAVSTKTVEAIIQVQAVGPFDSITEAMDYTREVTKADVAWSVAQLHSPTGAKDNG